MRKIWNFLSEDFELRNVLFVKSVYKESVMWNPHEEKLLIKSFLLAEEVFTRPKDAVSWCAGCVSERAGVFLSLSLSLSEGG